MITEDRGTKHITLFDTKRYTLGDYIRAMPEDVDKISLKFQSHEVVLDSNKSGYAELAGWFAGIRFSYHGCTDDGLMLLNH